MTLLGKLDVALFDFSSRHGRRSPQHFVQGSLLHNFLQLSSIHVIGDVIWDLIVVAVRSGIKCRSIGVASVVGC